MKPILSPQWLSLTRARSALATTAGVLALTVAGHAQARDVHWSIGIQSPGVSVGVSSQAPVVVYPQPVYVHPQPVYVHPQQVYPLRPPRAGYVQPVVVYPSAPVAVWGPPAYGHGHRHGHKHRPDRHDRWERDDDRHDRRWR